jgi:predicted GNAT family acetyltransferase
MSTDGWHLNEDVDVFLARAGDFLRSRPALHTMHLTVTEKLRGLDRLAYDAWGPVLGRLEQPGKVQATFYRMPLRGLSVTSLDPEQADTLAEHLISLGHALPSVTADDTTARAFAQAWQRRTGMTPTLRVRLHLYRLVTLTPPKPVPAGRGRAAGEQDHAHLMCWCRELAADLGEEVTINADSWAGTRFAEKRFAFWETPDGTPVSMAGVNPMVAGQARVDPVYTPTHLRGRGYAGAVTVEVSRAALAAGVTDVVLFTNAANPTSNALYERIGYRRIADFATYDLGYAAPEAD